MTRVFLGLGSNRGNSHSIIEDAKVELGEFLIGFVSSRLWISRPRYVIDQADFFNCTVSGWTELSAHDLLAEVNRIEALHGRDRTKERVKGPRYLDIDILLYGNELVHSPFLTIPHESLHERKFVLLPLLDIDPDLSLPPSGTPLKQLVASLSPQGIYLEEPCGYDHIYK